MEAKTYSVPQMAAALGISKSLAYELVKSGQIRSIRLGTKRIVIPVSEIEKLLSA